jgi:myo-inositol-1(or 4)-monophosphatase
MKQSEQQQALTEAVAAARAVGALMRRHLNATKRAQSVSRHDIKLELDVQCQRLIERRLSRAFPDIAVLGEEGVQGDPAALRRWVIDPIDGTVNFTYGIPHACVSIALQSRATATSRVRQRIDQTGSWTAADTVVGVVYDPFADELWTALRGRAARLNGRKIRVSTRRRLGEAIASIGFAKDRRTLKRMLPVFERLIHRVRKVRMMGSAALALTYVASGRMDLYLESGIRWWDIAAGGLILECAGGDFRHHPVDGPDTYRLTASNGRYHSQLRGLQ